MPRSKRGIRIAPLPLRKRGTTTHAGSALLEATDPPVRNVIAMVGRSVSLASEGRWQRYQWRRAVGESELAPAPGCASRCIKRWCARDRLRLPRVRDRRRRRQPARVLPLGTTLGLDDIRAVCGGNQTVVTRQLKEVVPGFATHSFSSRGVHTRRGRLERRRPHTPPARTNQGPPHCRRTWPDSAGST